ncbi:MAG: STAS/SEC14 domain-containing protein, partial [Candidatus Thermoplasmatota archaeon]|nr:STAS/SEC14 domain-containing protein [Candidatus Thermoplasmatota archaeon]
GEMDDKTVVAMKEAYFKLDNMVDGKLDALIDLNKAGQQSAGARKTWKELSENENSGKLAIIGISPVAKVIASFVMGVTNKEDMRFFKSKDEALAWLKE